MLHSVEEKLLVTAFVLGFPMDSFQTQDNSIKYHLDAF